MGLGTYVLAILDKYRGMFSIRVIVSGNEVQILDEAVYVSLYVHTIWKGMKPFVLPLDMDK